MVTGPELTKTLKFSGGCVTRVRLGSDREIRATSHGVICKIHSSEQFSPYCAIHQTMTELSYLQTENMAGMVHDTLRNRCLYTKPIIKFVDFTSQFRLEILKSVLLLQYFVLDFLTFHLCTARS